MHVRMYARMYVCVHVNVYKIIFKRYVATPCMGYLTVRGTVLHHRIIM